jgi:hypothetical protein
MVASIIPEATDNTALFLRRDSKFVRRNSGARRAMKNGADKSRGSDWSVKLFLPYSVAA